MKEDFLIMIDSSQEVGPKKDTISLRALGSYEFSPERKQLCFYEYDPENPEEKSFSTLIVDKDNKITFTKEGSVTAQLILQKGQRHMCHYITEYGALQVGTFTEIVDVDLDQNGGKIVAEYTIDINSAVTSHNIINIKIREAEKSYV